MTLAIKQTTSKNIKIQEYERVILILREMRYGAELARQIANERKAIASLKEQLDSEETPDKLVELNKELISRSFGLDGMYNDMKNLTDYSEDKEAQYQRKIETGEIDRDTDFWCQVFNTTEKINWNEVKQE